MAIAFDTDPVQILNFKTWLRLDQLDQGDLGQGYEAAR